MHKGKVIFNKTVTKEILYMNIPFIYKNPIISSLLKVVTLKFTMYILTILKYSL